MATTVIDTTPPHLKPFVPSPAPATVSTERSTIWGWITTTDHKKIGTLYLFTALFFFLVGGIFRQGKGRCAAGSGGLGLLASKLLARLAIGILRRLLGLILGLLRLLGHHDAEIMLRMLKVILGHYPIAAGIGVASQLQILLIDMAGGAANLDLRP